MTTSYSTTGSPPDLGPNPYVGTAMPPPAVQTSAGLAFLLGLIPGVGAIYNGQYLKGFMHVAVLGVLISVLSSGHVSGSAAPFVGLLIASWFFYMPFEAYHTAKKRQMGVPVDEWSSLLPRQTRSGRLPIGPVVLIGIGVIFLLDSLDILSMSDVFRFWPLLPIGLGVYLLYLRLSGPAEVPPNPPAPPSGEVMGARHE